MGWWLLLLSAKMLALLLLSVNFFQLRFFFFKELNTHKPVFVVSLNQNKVLRVI